VGLRTQILSNPETVSDLAVAAESRFRDAEALLAERRYQGSIYLLGFSAEMWLKYAAFRFLGMRLSRDVASLLGPARTMMRAHIPAVAPEGYHSLLFWCEYLLLLRRSRQMRLPTEIEGRLRHHVANRLFEDWKVDLRYSSIAVTERECWRAYADAAWVRANASGLWR
jgi:hypothetical protein